MCDKKKEQNDETLKIFAKMKVFKMFQNMQDEIMLLVIKNM